MLRRTRPRVLLLVAALPAVTLFTGGVAFAGPVSGELFYTTFRAPNPVPVGPPFISDGTVNRVTFDFNGTTLTLGSPQQIHTFGTASNADGIAFASDGDLLIGGGNTGNVHKLPASGGTVTSVAAGNPNAFHLAVSPDGNTVYTAGLPGGLSAVPLNPFANGTPHGLSGDDVNITQIAFDNSGNAYYTASDAFGNGQFGTIDLTTFVTTRTIPNLPAAHGMAWDDHTNTIILAGDNHISQIDPADLATLKSDLTITIPAVNDLLDHFDQVSVDGEGHAFAAINNGNVFFLDYTDSGEVNASGNVQQIQFLQNFLDDIAPLSGPGAPNVEPPPPPPGGIPLPAAVWPGVMLLGSLWAAAKAKRRRRA
ncbi:MAG: hypothetical protein QOF78_3238 [Phycisphaerales bacterium]|jgi:hypothetical protein|nr:hypothetical protein [Phycisphaerales bacterium]